MVSPENGASNLLQAAGFKAHVALTVEVNTVCRSTSANLFGTFHGSSFFLVGRTAYESAFDRKSTAPLPYLCPFLSARL